MDNALTWAGCACENYIHLWHNSGQGYHTAACDARLNAKILRYPREGQRVRKCPECEKKEKGNGER